MARTEASGFGPQVETRVQGRSARERIEPVAERTRRLEVAGKRLGERQRPSGRNEPRQFRHVRLDIRRDRAERPGTGRHWDQRTPDTGLGRREALAAETRRLKRAADPDGPQDRQLRRICSRVPKAALVHGAQGLLQRRQPVARRLCDGLPRPQTQAETVGQRSGLSVRGRGLGAIERRCRLPGFRGRFVPVGTGRIAATDALGEGQEPDMARLDGALMPRQRVDPRGDAVTLDEIRRDLALEPALQLGDAILVRVDGFGLMREHPLRDVVAGDDVPGRACRPHEREAAQGGCADQGPAPDRDGARDRGRTFGRAGDGTGWCHCGRSRNRPITPD